MIRPTTFDPYHELGVTPSAGHDQIKMAHKRAVKRTHPDAGGKAEDFHRAQTAAMILLDPARRAKFDADGTIDDGPADPTRAAALMLIIAFVQAACNLWLAGPQPGRPAPTDPRRRKLLDEFRERTNEEIFQLSASLKDGDKTVRFLADMAARFDTDQQDNAVRRALEDAVRNAKAQIAAVKAQIEHRRMAIEIVGRYGFRVDEVPETVTFVWDVSATG